MVTSKAGTVASILGPELGRRRREMRELLSPHCTEEGSRDAYEQRWVDDPCRLPPDPPRLKYWVRRHLPKRRAMTRAMVPAAGGNSNTPSDPVPAGTYSPSSVLIARVSASIVVGTAIWLMAMSGSLSPCPVSTHTTVEPSGTLHMSSPATDAADAGSQN